MFSVRLAAWGRMDSRVAPACAAVVEASAGSARFVPCLAELEGNGLAEQKSSGLPNSTCSLYLHTKPVVSLVCQLGLIRGSEVP